MPSPSAARCPRCFGAPRFCLCDALVPTPSRVPVLVLQHVLELKQVSNTGRFVPLLLERAEQRVFGAKGRPLDTSGLATPGTVLLFPGEAGRTVERAAVQRLVVVDASWSQAKRMVQRVPELRGLPRLSLDVTPERSLRDAPPGTLSTLQAVARALEWLGDGAADALDAFHARLTARTLAARGYL